MPILDLQQQLTQAGRIRLGASKRSAKGHKVPTRLASWRLTSRDRVRLDAAAELYGGTVAAWEEKDGEWVLDTEAVDLPIMLLPGRGFSQWWELWGKPDGGKLNVCLRRCDGRTEQLGDQPCLCPPEYDDRRELATEGKACQPTTRLTVLLPEVPGVGGWRLDTRGYYAAVELAGTGQLLEQAMHRGVLLPARLRIDQRKAVKGDTTVAFPVPVIDIDVPVTQVHPALLEERAPLQLVPPPEPEGYGTVPPPDEGQGGRTVQQALDKAGTREVKQTANAQEPIGAPRPQPTTPPPAEPEDTSGALWEGAEPAPPGALAELPPVAAPQPVQQPAEVPQAQPHAGSDTAADSGPVISDGQRRRLWAIANERGVPEEAMRAILAETTGQESTAAILMADYDVVVAAIEGAQV